MLKRLAAVVVVAAVAAVAGAVAAQPTGTLPLRLTFNVTPNAEWEPGLNVRISADARRNPNINEEDIFARIQVPGTHPRPSTQVLDFSAAGVKLGEKIIVQGYMCAEGTTDCYPSDTDNPPSCSVTVRVLGGYRPSCQPVFTWTGGSGSGGVLCSATCQ